MTQLVRGSIFGQFLHLVSSGKLLPHQEQRNPSLWQTRLPNEKPGRIFFDAAPNNLERAGAGSGDEASSTCSSSTNVSREIVLDDALSEASTKQEDAEEGKDPNLVDWYGPEDPDVRRLSFCR